VYGGVAAGIIGAVALGGALRPGAAAPPAHLTVSPAKFDTRRWADSVSAVRTENARRLSHDVTLHLRIAAKGDEDQQ
jgi:hypothetical protein